MGNRIGAERAAATRLGLSLVEYRKKRRRQKWCTLCKAWHAKSAFAKDARRSDGLSADCRAGHAKRARAAYVRRPATRAGPVPAAPRDGDKRQARARINTLVRYGKLAHPNTLPCVDCGHVWRKGSKRRHEYDHSGGYGPLFHLAVEVVCQGCHLIREGKRLLRLP